MNQKGMIRTFCGKQITGMKCLATLIAAFFFGSVFGQSTQLIDSLERTLNTYGSDDKAFALYTLVSYYQRSDRQKTLQFRQRALPLLNDVHPKAQAYSRIIEGIYYTGVGSLDSAEYWFASAKESARIIHDDKTMAIICASLGRTLVAAGKEEAAVSNLVEGLRLADKDPDQELAMKLRINLTWAYLELKRYRDGVNLGRHTLALMDSTLQWMALYLYNNMAVCYGALNQLDSARYFVERGIHAAELNHDYQSLANGHFILGTIYANAGRNDLAIGQYEQAKPYREKVGNPFFIVSDLYTLASLYQKTGNFSKGVQTGLEALDIAEKHHLLLKFENTYQVLAMNYEGLHDFKKSSQYYQLWAASKDSVYKNANTQAIADMETKYETEKKEQQIVLQTATISAQKANIQRNYIFIGGLVIVVVLVVVILFLIRSDLKRKQEVLKKEYELSVREAFIAASIQSQEHERKRFAQDLHDGMGQLISALRFIVVSRDTVSSGNGDERMAKAEYILNDMHREIRDVAFNLMPQTLIRNGLIPAIQEVATRVNSTGQIRLSVSSFEMPERLTELHEISLYRVIQEWVNNILKYASASAVQVQLVAHEDEITLTIEDDGEGFERHSLENSSGNGWKNIQSRLSLIKGSVEVDTQPLRKGTTFIVVMPWRRS